jgi:hypothetical protein
MIEHAENLAANVRNQPSVQRNIQQLMPAANHQQQFALPKCFVKTLTRASRVHHRPVSRLSMPGETRIKGTLTIA